MTLNDEDIKYIESIVDQKIANLSTKSNTKTRKKSEWQTFLGPCMKSLPKEKAIGEKVKECSIEYRKVKTNNLIKPIKPTKHMTSEE